MGSYVHTLPQGRREGVQHVPPAPPQNFYFIRFMLLHYTPGDGIRSVGTVGPNQ